jgi:hypothetical protein
MVCAFDLIIQSLVIRGLRPSLQRLDSEASLALRNYLTKKGIDYQLAPPHIHRRKNAERAIQTFKNHFIAGLCSVDSNVPLKLLDKLLPQATITLNLLRKSRINPRMSAYAQLNGHFYFKRTPMAPPGTCVIAYKKPDQRASWDPHGVDGYYLGPELDHYRCYQVHITKTKGTRIVDTVEFFPFKESNATNIIKGYGRHCSLGTVQCPSERSPCGSFQSHCHCATPSIAPTLRDLLSYPPINNNTTCTPNVSSLLKIQEHSPPCPCAIVRLPILAPPAPITPSQSPLLFWYPSQRVSPRQAPSLRVAPRVNPVYVASPRVNRTLTHNSVIPLSPHPAAANAPYVPQGMAGVNLFDTFEEEHNMETPSLPRYNTRARARQHSANQAQHLAPYVLRPITLTNMTGRFKTCL